MTIDELYVALSQVDLRIREKAKGARRVARDARTKGNKTKHDKFNAVARVYGMVAADIGPLSCELLNLASPELRADDIPF